MTHEVPAEAPPVTRPPFEVADIVRQHGDRFLESHRAWVTGHHRRVPRGIAQCRTAFNFWRPVTAIRAGDTDDNDNTIPDPTWDSLLNSPALPDYPSTHSILGGAASEVLRRFFHHDSIEFTTTSGAPFAGITRSFASFSDAAEENGNSRIYAGIHFRSAVRDDIAQGKQIGRFVFTHALRPVDDDEGRR
jgi:VCPO second helical-bundle domain